MASSPARKSGFPIVGVGASAGGLEALEELLNHMPTDTGMAFVVVAHQDPGRTSLLPELLGRSTALKVVEATDGLKVEPNHVYVKTPGGNLAILNGTLHRMETGVEEALKLPIDYVLLFTGLGSEGKSHLHHSFGQGGRWHVGTESD
jgi:two-component system CheB/CheR fusion protein